MIILGIESSCDDSSVATYNTHTNTFHELTKTQNIHNEFGGVVPELASRNHAIDINELLNSLLSNFDLKKLDLIAFTQGPGLIWLFDDWMCFCKIFCFESKNSQYWY